MAIMNPFFNNVTYKPIAYLNDTVLNACFFNKLTIWLKLNFLFLVAL